VVYDLFNPDTQPSGSVAAPEGRPGTQKAFGEPGELLLAEGVSAGEHERISDSIGAEAC